MSVTVDGNIEQDCHTVNPLPHSVCAFPELSYLVLTYP